MANILKTGGNTKSISLLSGRARTQYDGSISAIVFTSNVDIFMFDEITLNDVSLRYTPEKEEYTNNREIGEISKSAGTVKSILKKQYAD